MKKPIVPLVASLLSVCCLYATAQTVSPLKGQSQETMQQDMSACQTQAGTTSSASTDSSQSGGRARGAAKGAVAGAVVNDVRAGQNSNAYDRLDSDTKQEYRQSQSKDAAKTGMVVGGSRQRQGRRNTRQDSAANASAYSACLQQRGYQVTP